ncbi:hypothetical protein JCM11641_008346 [Rhodosporidiobolus odoratus]
MQWTNSHNQPLQTLPSSPFSQPHLLSSPSHAPTPSPFPSSSTHPYNHPNPHHVPFGQLPGSQPGALGWGVGMSAANGGGAGFGFAKSPASAGNANPRSSRSQTPTSVGWGSAAAATAGAASPALGTGGGSRRRRRSATPDSSEDEAGQLQQVRAIRPVRPQLISAKRARTAGDAASLTAGSLSLGNGSGLAVGDLGKALASLDKPSLLDVFSKLLSTSPHLASTISALLPNPRLSTILTTLSTLEQSILTALPTGAFLRDDYIWSRVRLPLEEYVAEARRFLGLFVPTHASSATAGLNALSEEDLTHPSTAFQFLHGLTLSLIRLEAALPPSPSPSYTATPTSASNPNPLTAHLVPPTLNAWHLFLTRLSHSINTSGRIFPSSLMTTWFEKLDEISPLPVAPLDAFRVPVPNGVQGGPSGGVRKLMEGVRERMRKEVGWLVGYKSAPSVGGGGIVGETGRGMVEEEEEEL